MIESFKFIAETYPNLVFPCYGCEKQGCRSKIYGEDREKKFFRKNQYYAEQLIQCFTQKVLDTDFYEFESQKKIKESFRHNTSCAVNTESPFKINKTDYPLDILISTTIPIEIKSFKNQHDYIGSYCDLQFTDNHLFVSLPGEHDSISQHFTDLIKIIRYLSIVDESNCGYLLQYNFTNRPNYLWDILHSFNGYGNIIILTESMNDWEKVPIWGALCFIITDTNNEDFFDITLKKPHISFADISMFDRILIQRNRFYTFHDLVRLINDEYFKQFSEDNIRFRLKKYRIAGEFVSLDIISIKKL